MSIVERALNRIRENGQPARRDGTPAASPAAAGAAASHEAATAAGPAVAGALAGSLAGSSAAATLAARITPTGPAESVERALGERARIDYDKLRSAGVLPPEGGAQRLIEEFRRIKWNVIGGAFGRGADPVENGRFVLVTSSTPNEGKTFTSINLALSLAREKDCSVVLVDADTEKCTVSHLLNVADRAGLTDLLSGEAIAPAEAICPTDLQGLYLLPAGRPHPHAPEMLGSRRMDALVTWCYEQFTDSIILFDSPPLLATNDAQVLSRTTGQILMVVRADFTPQPVVKEALEVLGDAPNVNIVLNRVHRSSLSEYYGAYYGYGRNRAP